MRESIKSAIGETVQDMVDSGIKVCFTKKELDLLGVEIPKVQFTTNQIRAIRKQMNLSQTVLGAVPLQRRN